MNVQPTLVADDQSPELAEPSKRALHHPPVPAQPLAALYSSAGYAGDDPSPSECSSAALEVISFVSMQLAGTSSATSTQKARLLDRLDGIQHVGESVGVVDISRSADHRERDSFGVDHNMALRALFALVCGVRPCTLAPLFAGTLALSTEARDQSILPSSPNLSSSTWCSFSHTPASCQSLSRRQQVMPLPQPISGGRYDQGKPVLSTKMMPVRAARLDTLGRPPFGFGGSGGKSGSITSHSSSDTSGLAIR